jgi:hypothetical protein
MKLKLSDWASLAEILGSVAVIVSLIYVGVQVSDSTSAVRSASVNDASLAVQSWYQQVGSDQQASALFYKAIMSKKPLPNHEEFQFIMGFHGLFLGFQNSYLMAQEGTLNVETVDAFANVMLGIKETPGFRRFWRQRKSFLHPEFANYVDQVLERDVNLSMEMYRNSNVEKN